jgi:tetratricopeptide (TPR) repeat protein
MKASRRAGIGFHHELRGLSRAVLTTLAVLLTGSFGRAQTPEDRLDPGKPVERELAAGQVHAYRLEGGPGFHLLITAEQKGIDVALSISGSGREDSGAVDAVESRWGTETLLVPPGGEGGWLLEVRPSHDEAPAGRYEVTVEELAGASPEEGDRIEAEQLMTEAARLLRPPRKAESLRQAVARYTAALRLWRKLGRRRDEARTLSRLGEAHQSLSEPRQAVERFEQALSFWTELGIPEVQADTLTGLGLARWGLGENDPALELFHRALEIRTSLGDRQGEAAALNNIGLIQHSRGDWTDALASYQEALRLNREAGDRQDEAVMLMNLGGVYDLLGEPQRAFESYGQALDLARTLSHRTVEARILNNLGVLHANLGQDDALRCHDQALALFREAGDRAWEARTLNNLGYAYRVLGEPRRALAFFEQALPLRREVGDRRGEAVTLNNLGLVQQSLGNAGAALEPHQRALEIARELGDRKTEASSLTYLAQARLATGEARRALDLLAQAVALLRELGDRRGLAQALQRAAEARAGLGGTGEAVAALEEALALRRAVEDQAGEAETLTALARLEDGLGLRERARTHVEEALQRIESLRTRVTNPDLRASFLSSRKQAFELAIDLRMDLDRREPGRGHAEEALALSERARARTLLDLLAEAGADIREGIDPDLREREREVARRLAAKTQRRMELLSGPPAAGERKAASDREMRDLLAEADSVEAEIRRRSPRYAGLTRPQPLGASGIQGLLDPGTILLEYSLGEARSFLWMVTPGSVAAFELPPRLEIEAAARRIYEDLRIVEVGPAEDAQRATAARRSLSRVLLGPVAGLLGEKRLAIVPDGALDYVPFAALPLPDAPEALLLERHEIVSLPSASVLAMQRQTLAGRAPAARTLAVLADPVFDPRDPRVHAPATPPAALSGAPSRRPAGLRGTGLARLQASRREAEVISALLPPEEVSTALGFEARRSAVLGGGLAGFRIVHLATHGWIDAETPGLSGMALSMVDPEGQPQEGFLGLGDIYNLDLDAGCALRLRDGPGPGDAGRGSDRAHPGLPLRRSAAGGGEPLAGAGRPHVGADGPVLPRDAPGRQAAGRGPAGGAALLPSREALAASLLLGLFPSSGRLAVSAGG